MVRRALVAPVPLALSLVAALAVAPSAQAVTLEEKLSALSGFTQPTASSAEAWRDAWADRGSWADFDFDWSSDGCTSSPDQPMGFDFSIPCRRHDFGYRNYQAVGDFPANKERIDKAFFFDLKQVCTQYSIFRQPSCNALAKLYYQAVRHYGAPRGTGGEIVRVPDRDSLRQQGAAESADGGDKMFAQSPPGFFD
ncbi:phospholipase [Nonomuraea sp. NPDC005692]|uniref:phospholipase n=1 Tax=Nonomuraea sp. NPDC005692 TaxID=3157168 RepID=UPI0033F79E46